MLSFITVEGDVAQGYVLVDVVLAPLGIVPSLLRFQLLQEQLVLAGSVDWLPLQGQRWGGRLVHFGVDVQRTVASAGGWVQQQVGVGRPVELDYRRQLPPLH